MISYAHKNLYAFQEIILQIDIESIICALYLNYDDITKIFYTIL